MNVVSWRAIVPQIVGTFQIDHLSKVGVDGSGFGGMAISERRTSQFESFCTLRNVANMISTAY
jgi:hypothetical protein